MPLRSRGDTDIQDHSPVADTLGPPEFPVPLSEGCPTHLLLLKSPTPPAGHRMAKAKGRNKKGWGSRMKKKAGKHGKASVAHRCTKNGGKTRDLCYGKREQPTQTNDWDCGMFMFAAVLQSCRGKRLAFGQAQMKWLRARLLLALANKNANFLP